MARPRTSEEYQSPTERTTIDGKTLTLTPKLAEELKDFNICNGGAAMRSIERPPHKFRIVRSAIWWDDKQVSHRVEFSKEQARRLFWCRLCNRFMGCMGCIDNTLVAEIECAHCHQYANDIGFKRHGTIVAWRE